MKKEKFCKRCGVKLNDEFMFVECDQCWYEIWNKKDNEAKKEKEEE